MKTEHEERILNCKTRGFHEHPPFGEGDLYEHCKHVKEVNKKINVIDFRLPHQGLPPPESDDSISKPSNPTEEADR